MKLSAHGFCCLCHGARPVCPRLFTCPNEPRRQTRTASIPAKRRFQEIGTKSQVDKLGALAGLSYPRIDSYVVRVSELSSRPESSALSR